MKKVPEGPHRDSLPVPGTNHWTNVLGHDDFLAVREGLVEITGGRIASVTDMAVAAADIDEARAEEARQRAAARLRDKISDAEVATVNGVLARAQLRVKRRRRV
jgi:F-type H+-transporting ATPase subunit epsilon